MNGLAIGLMLPFAGTALGAACVFLMRREMPQLLQKTLTGFAAGVMVAASVWSLLIPSMENDRQGGIASVIPSIVGFAVGILFLLSLDYGRAASAYRRRHERRPEKRIVAYSQTRFRGDAA